MADSAGIPLYICLHPDKNEVKEGNTMNKEKKPFNGVKEMKLHQYLNLKKELNLICSEMVFIPMRKDKGLRQF